MAYVVGQEIGYGRHGRYGLSDSCISTITKINGHGHVFVDDKVFDKHGNERGSGVWTVHLMPADFIRDAIAAEKDRRARTATVNSILYELSKKKTGCGDYAQFSDEDKKSLCDRINAL